MKDLPDEIREFLQRYVRSLGHLEVLLFLFQRRGEIWRAETVGRELRSNKNYALRQLRELVALSLIREPSDESFVYDQNPQLDEILEKTQLVYEKRRVSLVDMFYSQPMERIRSFSDAFRIKKEKE